MKKINDRYLIDLHLKDTYYYDVYLVKDILTKNLVELVLLKPELSSNNIVETIIEKHKYFESFSYDIFSKIIDFDVVKKIDESIRYHLQYYYTREPFLSLESVDYQILTKGELINILIELINGVKYFHYVGKIFEQLNFDNMVIYKKNDRYAVKLIDLITLELKKNLIFESDEILEQFISPEVKYKNELTIQADYYSLGKIIFYIYYQLDYQKMNFRTEISQYGSNDLILSIKNMTSYIASNRTEKLNNILSKLSGINSITESIEHLNINNIVMYYPEYYDKNSNFKNLKNKIIERYNYENKINGFAIIGENGTGKTRIIDELMSYFNLKKINSIKIAIKEKQDNSFYLIREILKKLDIDEKAEISNLSNNGIDIFELSEPSSNKNIESKNLTISNRLMNIVIEKIKFKKMVLLIDNAHYLASNEIKMLNYYFSSNQIFPITFVFSIDRLFEHKSFEFNTLGSKIDITELKSFDNYETNKFIKSILGMNSEPNNLVSNIMDFTNGNPKKIIDLIKEKIDNGVLYLREDFQWFIQTDKEVISISDDVEIKKGLKLIEELGIAEQEILKLIAIFGMPLKNEYLFEMTTFSCKDGENAIKNLIDKKLIVQKNSNDGYLCEFKCNTLKVVYKSLINEKDYLLLSEKVAKVIKKHTDISNYQFNLYLINNYRVNKQYKNAVNLSIRVAEELGRNKNVSKQIRFYEIAYEINIENNLETENLFIYRYLAEIYMNIGENSEAFEFINKSISVADLTNNMEAYIDSVYLKLSLMIKLNMMKDAEEIVKDVLNKIDKDKIGEGYYKISYINSRILCSKNKIEDFLKHSKRLLEEAINGNYKEAIARFYNELGIAYSSNNQDEKAIECYKNSYDKFVEIGDYIEATRPINNIGVIYSENYGKYSEAREYFLRAFNAIEDNKNYHGRIIYLSNIGETYYFEDDYENALKYALEAESTVKITKNSYFGFTIYLSLFNIYVDTGIFDKAFGYMNKLENEIAYSVDRGSEIEKYYLTATKFYIHINDFEKAEEYLNKLYNDSQFANNNKLQISIFQHNIVTYKRKLYDKSYNNDIQFIKSIKSDEMNINDTKIFRNYILEVANSLFYTNKIMQITYLLDLDERLSKIIDTSGLRLKRKIAKGILEEDRIEYYKGLLNSLVQSKDKWIVYDLLGREYFYKDYLFSAFNYLFSALDEIKKIYKILPFEQREKFIFYDSNKIELRNFIINIMAKLLGNYVLDDEMIFSEYDIGDINNFFELKYYDRIISHKKISGVNTEEDVDKKQFSSITDLINSFVESDYENIKLILKYLKQFVYCDYAAIYTYDSNNKISEIIEEGISDNYDITRVLRNFYGTEGILINSFLNIGNLNYLQKDYNALMVMPLKVNSIRGFNRRVNKLDKSNQNSYLYMFSKSPFNNFTNKAFEEILKLNRFIYQYVEKYFLNNFFIVDMTTGLYMRSHIEQCIQQEIYYSKLSDKKFSIMMADIDFFKEINDQFGHKKGDDVLHNIGSIFKKTLRESDIIGRYGGEEFVALLPNTDEDNAIEVVERLREKIANFSFKGLKDKITISFGISVYPIHSETLEELIEKADQALYISKATGRNKVTVWNSSDIEKQGMLNTMNDIISVQNTNRIMKLINIVRMANDNIEKKKQMMIIIMKLVDAKYCTLIDIKRNCLSKNLSDEDFINENLFDEFLIDEYLNNNQGAYFVDWKNLCEVNLTTDKMSWRSIIASPIYNGKEHKGLLLLGVPVFEKEFSYNEYNLIYNIVPLLSTVL